MALPSTEIIGFHWADYVVFTAVLVISAVIGLVSAVKHRRATADQLLTGNRKLPLIPVTLSLTVSFISAVSILGIPAEGYFNSTEYWLVGLGFIPAQIITCFLIMPVFYKLQLTSAYQYLELRFNRIIRLMGSFTFIVEMVMYMAVAMYAPALALMANLSMEVSILASGLVCTLYTALGGIRAVVWTDAFQVVIILAGYLTLIVMGTRSVGGWSVVMDRAREGDRFTWDLDMRPDPFIRHTFWTLFVGGTFASLVVYASNQAMLQRYLSVRNLKTARMTILLHLPFSEVFLALGMLSGLVMYAFYYGCDPLKLGILMPLFVLQTLGDYPGLPGLFVACIYSAALSTISSGVNSLAAVTLEDFLRPWVDRVAGGRRSSRLHSVVTVVLALVYGLATIGLAYLAGILDSTILQIAISILGMVGGPLLGLLIVGIFFPCINSWGAGVGLVCSLCVSLWVGVGAILNTPPRRETFPRPNTLLCNVTDDVTNTTTVTYSLTSTESALGLLNTTVLMSNSETSGR
ncbi:hypothetical protein BaRGS_00010629 [Batillaria attramentaria]|uniref:Sodium-dependent multivitamin transporter n=1 Tax=Batillaria attramentaria TaxID=370345 RepID=A0ABD0LEZ0_9CAEN